MSTKVIAHHLAPGSQRSSSTVASIVEFALEHYLAVPLGAVVAVIWANTRPESYYTFAHAAAFLVNDIGMAFFVALIAQETWEAVMPGGALHTWRRWLLPIAGAIGGVVGSAAVYYIYVSASYQEILRAGLPAATAVDLAFAYFVIQAIFHRHAVVPFLLLLAFATNVVGFLTMGSQQTWADVRPGGAAFMAAALVLAYILRRLHVRSFWPYLFGAGTLSWWALYLDGLHPALALLPVVPFLPHAPRRGDVLADLPHGHRDSPSRFEHVWTYAVQGVLLLFVLVNAGVVFARYGAGTWALLSASLLGRPLGILAAVVVATKMGLHLPARVNWRDVIVAACAASIGFTMTLFFATSTYPFGPVLSELKVGALASGSGVLLAIGAAWLLSVGRFSRDARDHHRYVPDVIL